MLYQIYYYRYFYEAQRRDEASQNANNDINGANTTNINEESTREETPLLNGQTQERKERKTTARRLLNALSSSGFIRYLLALTFVFSTGIVAWLVSRVIQGNSNGSGNDNEDGRPKDVIEWKSQVIGWTSAVLYRKFLYLIIIFLLLRPFLYTFFFLFFSSFFRLFVVIDIESYTNKPYQDTPISCIGQNVVAEHLPILRVYYSICKIRCPLFDI